MSSPPTKRICLDVSANSSSVTTKDNTNLAIIDAHPDGDIILDVGSGVSARSLRVSSGVLTAASGFFVDLFGAKLKENFNPCSAADPKHVPMDTDDPQAMLDLCNLLHYRSDQVKMVKGAQLMDGKIGIYFRSAVKSTVALEKQTNQLPLLDVMALGYLFDNFKYFRLASEPLIATSRLSPELQAILPAELLDLLRRKRQTAIMEICTDAEDTVAGVFHDGSLGSVSLTATSNGNRPSYCKPSLQKFAFYMGCLNNVGLWPLRNDCDGDVSVADTLEKVAEVSRERRPGKCGARFSSCDSCNLDVGKGLIDVVELHKRNLTGLCLRCVQKGEYTDEAFREPCPKHGPKVAAPTEAT